MWTTGGPYEKTRSKRALFLNLQGIPYAGEKAFSKPELF